MIEIIYEEDYFTPRGREFTWAVLRWNCLVSPLFVLYALLIGNSTVTVLGSATLLVGCFYMRKLRLRLFSDAVGIEADNFLRELTGEPLLYAEYDSYRYMSLKDKMKDNGAETEGGSDWFFDKFSDERFER